MKKDILLTDFLGWYGVTRGRSERTVQKYRSILNRYFKYLEKEHKVNNPVNATLLHLEGFTGIHAHEQGISPNSRKPMVAALRQFYAWLVRNRYLAESTAAQLQYPKAGRPLPIAARLETIQKLIMAPNLKTFAGVRDAAIMAILFDVGCRRSGIVNLNDSDLQWQQSPKGEQLVLKLREKGKKERLVPVTTETRLLIRAYLAHPDLTIINRVLEGGDQVLFVSTTNSKITADKYHGEERRFSPNSINNIILKYGIPLRLPVKELHPHAFRHLVGTEIYENTKDLRAVADILGHVSLDTAAIYTQLAMRRKSEVMAESSPMKQITSPTTELAKLIESGEMSLSVPKP